MDMDIRICFPSAAALPTALRPLMICLHPRKINIQTEACQPDGSTCQFSLTPGCCAWKTRTPFVFYMDTSWQSCLCLEIPQSRNPRINWLRCTESTWKLPSSLLAHYIRLLLIPSWGPKTKWLYAIESALGTSFNTALGPGPAHEGINSHLAQEGSNRKGNKIDR